MDDIPIQNIEVLFYEGTSLFHFTTLEASKVPIRLDLDPSREYVTLSGGYFLWIDGLAPGNHSIRVMANTGLEAWCGIHWSLDVIHYIYIIPSQINLPSGSSGTGISGGN